MLKKFAILGLLLLVAGSSVLGLVLISQRKEQQQVAFYKSKYSSDMDECIRQYNEWLQLPPENRAQLPWGLDKDGRSKTDAQLKQEQQERLKGDLDRLAVGEKNVYPFADILYGENWQEELSKHKAQKELNEFAITGSVACMFTGGAICTWCLLLWTARLFIRGLSYLRKFFVDFFRSRKNNKWLAKTAVEENEETSPPRQKLHEHKSQLKKHSKALINSGWQDFSQQPLQQTAFSAGSKHKPDNSAGNAAENAWLLSDEESIESKEPVKATTENLNVKSDKSRQRTPESGFSSTAAKSLKLEDPLKAQTEVLERQVAEFKPTEQTVKQNVPEHSEPINNTLNELTQQVAAIRQYATQQQGRMEKLQDGYDWNIIRNFCLRVIRCLDNLENRINQLSEQGVDAVHLEEVRDELVFALESSGVEQFEPEINSNYRGQERCAEAVKDKECSDDQNLSGKIAKVIRHGYQYVIDEENVKIVRPSQVQLFG